MMKSKRKTNNKKKVTRASKRSTSSAVSATVSAMENLEPRQLLAAWSLQDRVIGLDKVAQNYPGITGAGETVVLIDRGVDYNHYALGGGFGKKIIDAWNFDTNSWDVFPYDNDAHGTGSAGEVAADAHIVNGEIYQGVAPGVKLVALKARGTWEIKQAFAWVVAHRTQYNIVGVNWVDTSGSSDASQWIPEMSALKNAGVFISAPAGNYGPGNAYPTVNHLYFQAGATNLSDQLSTYSPRGSNIDLFAPGDLTAITWYSNGQHMDYFSYGTSWAGPQMVGAAALIKQVNKNFTPDQIMQIMRDSAHWVYDSYSNSSYPRLDVNAAIGLAYQRSGGAFQAPAPTPTPTPTPAPTPTATSTAFKGTPFAAGSTIEAEWYDNGGEGVAFHDTTNWNESGLTYRGDGVDVGWSAGEGSNIVGWTHGGESLKYTINAAASGGYSIQARVSSAGTGGAFHIEIDGKDVTGAIAVPNTGAWGTYTTVVKDGIWINAGQHVMRVVMDTNGQLGFTGNFNWFKFNATSVGATTTTTTAFTPNTASIPNSPFAMTASALGGGSMKINWYDNADNESAFVIERADWAGGAFSVVGTLNADSTSSPGKGLRTFTATGLKAGITYYFRVKAINQKGSSNYTYASGMAT